MAEKPVGLTKDVGWQIGVRRTLPIHHTDAWKLLTSPKGVNLWLGKDAFLDLTKGAEYQLADGIRGKLRVFEPNLHLRVTWHPRGWKRASLIQVRTIPSGGQTVISFHQEHLPGSKEREERRAFYTSVLDQLELMINSD